MNIFGLTIIKTKSLQQLDETIVSEMNVALEVAKNRCNDSRVLENILGAGKEIQNELNKIRKFRSTK